MNKCIRLLTVDDEADMTRRIEKYFKGKGYIVSVANNGKKALETLQDKEFDVVVLDLLMPGMAGLDVLKVIKKKTPKVCVVILSAKDKYGEVLESVGTGAYDHIPKPFEFTDLAKAVEKGVEHQTLLNKLEEEKIEREKEKERKKGDEKTRTFIKGLNHQIKNAICGVSENTQLVLNTFPKGNKNNERIKRIEIFTNRIIIIVKQLSSLQKIDKEDFQKIELSKIIENSLDHSKYHQELQDEIEINKKYSTEITINASPLYLGIVFENLLNNAVEAMRENSEKKVLSINASSIDNKHVEIKFVDNGVGLDDKIKDQVFDQFFTTKVKKQLENDNTDFGRGFGLFFTKEIIMLHGGTIEIDNNSRDTTFIIKLPMAELVSDEY